VVDIAGHARRAYDIIGAPPDPLSDDEPSSAVDERES
jgi:hypothetical protein